MSLKQFLRSVVSSIRTDRRRKTAYTVHRMELLEQRALLAGNVLVTLQNGNATITGDSADNSVELVVSGSTLIVQGVDGTTINGATTAFTLSSTSTTFGGSLVAMLGAGDDAFSIGSGVTLSKTVKVSGEAGDDTLGVSGTVTGRLTLSAGAGSDAIAVRNATTPGGISIDASGSVVVAISDSTIGSSLVISTGNGDDDIVISDTTINSNTSITTRSGNDDIVLKDSTLHGKFYLSADRGDDVAVIDSTTIDGKSELWMREGEDSVQVQGNSVLSSRFFVGQRLGRNSTEVQSTATVSRLRQVGRPSSDVSDSLIETRITNSTTGAIAKADAVNAVVAPTLSVVIAANSIVENAGAAATTATITRTGSTTSALTVNLSSSNDSRAKFATTTAIIPAGQSSVTVNISAVDNTTADADATFTLTAAATGFTSGTDTVVVTGEEVAALTVTSAQSTFAENAAEAARTFTVSRNTTDNTAALTVNLASNTTGRLTVPATVTIPANASSVTFVATAINNTTVDASAQVIVTATATGLTNGTSTVTVTDDDSPSLTLSPSPSTVLENAGTGAVTFTVTRNATDTTAALIVNLSSGSARLTVPASVTIPAGQASATFTATPTNDSVFSGQTTVTVTATATGLTNGTGSVIINDDESAALSLTPSVTTFSESAAAPAVTYTISRNTADTSSAITVALTSSDTARLTVPATINIPAGQTSATFVGTPVNNTTADGSQLVTVTGTLTGFTTAQTAVTVTDDDAANLSISASPSSIAENAGDNSVTFTIIRNATATTSAITVDLSSSLTSRFTIPATVSIPVGQTTVTVAGTPVNNSNDDGNATVTISASATGLTSTSTTITVTDEDVPTLSITANPVSVAENAGSNAVTFTVSRNAADTSSALVVNLSDASSARFDIPATVTIPANSATATVQGTPVNNATDDGNATITVTASATGLTSDDVTVTVTDDDAATLSLTASPTSVAENAGANAITFTLSRNSGDVSQPLTVNLSSAATSRLTVPATATILAGQSSVTFFGAAVDDTVVNASLTVLVTASQTNFTSGTSTVTLTDNDTAALLLSSSSVSVNENSTTPITFTLSRTGDDVSSPVTVQLASGFVSRFSVPTSVTIPAGQTQTTFQGTAVNNSLIDGTSSVAILATAAGYTFGQSSINISDDDGAGPTLSMTLSAPTVAENVGANAATLVIGRTNSDNSTPLTVTLSASNTSRLTIPASVTIPAGQSTIVATLATIDNAAVDGPLNVILTASATGFADQRRALLVTDNETAVLNLSVAQNSVAEDSETLSGTVTTNITSSSDMVVNLTYSNSSQISGPATVTILAGQTSANVTFTVVNGGVISGSGTAKITAGAVGASLDVETITVNDVDVVPITTNISSNTTAPSNGTVITKNASFTITGTTTPNSEVTLDTDGDGAYDDATATVDSSGNYTVTITLTNTTTNRGANQIILRTENGPTDIGDAVVDVHYAVGTVVRFETNAGNYDVELLDTAAPITVANFLAYMNSTKYDNLIVHRNVADFVIQGGGFTVNNGQIASVTTNPAITNEFNSANSNLRGTLSMAQLGGQPSSGTSQWFVSTVNNTQLDAAQHTVFGRVIGTGMTVVDGINDITSRNISALYGQSALNEVPLRNAVPAGTQITGTVATTSGSAIITGTGTTFTTQLAVGDSIRIGTGLFFVQSIQSDTSLTLTSNASATAASQSVLKDVVPDDADFVIFSNISEILDNV